MKHHAPKTRQRTKRFTLGRAAFARISAVEGIGTTAEMEAEFREYDRQDLSPEERRRLISRKYANAR